MKRFFLPIVFAAVIGLAFASSLSAQSIGDGTGSGGSSGSGIGSGGSTGGSSSGIGSGSEIGSGSQFQSSSSNADLFQGVEANSSFIGINDGVPFIGREDVFGTSSSSRTSNVRSMTSNTRRTTTTRRSTGRSMSVGRTGSTSGDRQVRAATTTDFAFSPMEVDHRETSFRTRMGRLPNFRVIPDQVSIKVAETPNGSVAMLTGAVPTERDRKLVQQLVLLEPGIDKVDNKLVVTKSKSGDTTGGKTETLPKLDPGAEP